MKTSDGVRHNPEFLVVSSQKKLTFLEKAYESEMSMDLAGANTIVDGPGGRNNRLFLHYIFQDSDTAAITSQFCRDNLHFEAIYLLLRRNCRVAHLQHTRLLGLPTHHPNVGDMKITLLTMLACRQDIWLLTHGACYCRKTIFCHTSTRPYTQPVLRYTPAWRTVTAQSPPGSLFAYGAYCV